MPDVGYSTTAGKFKLMHCRPKLLEGFFRPQKPITASGPAYCQDFQNYYLKIHEISPAVVPGPPAS
jgi:hypothetical protein